LLFGVALAVRKGVLRKSYRKHIWPRWLSGFLIRMKNFSRSDIDGKHNNHIRSTQKRYAFFGRLM
jgi:hypothetical protein